MLRNKHLSTTLLLLLAALTSTIALAHETRFHADEAFYMNIARNAAIKGDWLFITEPLDKPPLTFYTNALSLTLFAVDKDENGVLFLDIRKGEFAGRLPSLLMSILLVAVCYRLALNIMKNRYVAFFAGLLVVSSPFRTAFGATAFTDMPMLLLATLALWMAVEKRIGWSGVFFALSIAAKPQSIFYLPLLIGLAQIVRTARLPSAGQLKRFFVPVIIVVALMWIWDVWRAASGGMSFYALGQANYTQTMLTPFSEYPERLQLIWMTIKYLFGHWWLTIVFWAIGFAGFIRKPSWMIALLWGWITAFLGIHTVLTLNTFDRNFIVLLPVGSAVVGYGVLWALQRTTQSLSLHSKSYQDGVLRGWGLRLILLLPLLTINIAAPIGSQGQRYDSMIEFAEYLNSKPIATVIYDPYLDWELDYYMGEWTNKRRVFYPTPDLLVRDALALDEIGTRYLVLPQDKDATEWAGALQEAGFTVNFDVQIGRFVSYAIVLPQD